MIVSGHYGLTPPFAHLNDNRYGITWCNTSRNLHVNLHDASDFARRTTCILWCQSLTPDRQ